MRLLIYLFYILLKKLKTSFKISSSVSYSSHLIINIVLLLMFLFDNIFSLHFNYSTYFIFYLTSVIVFFIIGTVYYSKLKIEKEQVFLLNKYGKDKLNTYQKVFNYFLSLVLIIDFSFIIALIIKVEGL